MLWYPVQRQRLPSRPEADRGLVRCLAALDQAHRGEHHARRAVAALERVVVVERLLDGVQGAVRGQTLDRRDLRPVGLDAEHRAGLDRLSVQEHRARSARRRVTADVRTGQAEAFSKDVDEKLARLQLELVSLAVDGQSYASQRALLSS